MAVEGDIKKIEYAMSEINRKLDALLEERETRALMAVSERSLSDFMIKEPELYSIKDVKARY